MSKKTLQILTGLLAAVPTITGLIAMAGISDPLYASLHLPRDATFDSNLRFYGGVWFGLGLAAFWLVPRIEHETALFTTVWGAIFFGGVGRLLSLLLVGVPLLPFVAFTALEIVGGPLFILWQRRIARQAAP